MACKDSRKIRVVPNFGSRLQQIRNLAFFSEIRPDPAPAKFLAGFGGCQCSCSMFS